MTISPNIVIVAEDEPLVRMLAADTLTDAGFDVVEASSAHEAVAALTLHAGNVAALFTDVHMPGGLSGMELAHVVRNRWPRVAILVTSGLYRPHTSELPLGGMFIAKPYQTDQVVAQIQAVIGSWL